MRCFKLGRTKIQKQKNELTARQEQILEFIISYSVKKGFSPSVREIMAHVRLNSESSVQFHLDKLQEKGYIRREKRRPRAIEILEFADRMELVITDKEVQDRLMEYCGRSKINPNKTVENMLKTYIPQKRA